MVGHGRRPWSTIVDYGLRGPVLHRGLSAQWAFCSCEWEEHAAWEALRGTFLDIEEEAGLQQSPAILAALCWFLIWVPSLQFWVQTHPKRFVTGYSLGLSNF